MNVRALTTIPLAQLACIISLFVCGILSNDTNDPGRPPQAPPVNPDSSQVNATGTGGIDWAREIIVFHRPEEVVLKMGEKTTVSVVISVMCRDDAVKYSILMETYNPEVAFFPPNQNVSFELNCNELSDSLMMPDKRLDSNADNESLSIPKLLAEGRQLSPYPRKVFSLNITVATDLLGRSWIMFIVNVTSTDDRSDDGQGSNYELRGDSRLEANATSATAGGEQREDTNVRMSKSGRIVHELPVVVLRKMRPIDIIFRVVLFSFVALNSVGMGCKTDLKVVKEVLKKPVAPVIGFIAQYIFMPLIAFTVSQVIKFDNPAVRLGIFTCGVCPGGGASNIFSYLLHGDVSLSVTMTCVSSVTALAMIPLWMFTLGQRFNDDKISVDVPFLRIIETLAIVIIPIFFGFFLNIKFPKIAAKIKKAIKPLASLTIIFILTVGIYSNLYVFRLFKGGTVIAACLLPYMGYILGGGLALIACQPFRRVKTVAIETGIQNTSVAYLMLTFSLPPPDGDLAAVGSAASAFMTPMPLVVLSVIYNVYLQCKKRKQPKYKGGAESGIAGDAGNGEKESSPLKELSHEKEGDKTKVKLLGSSDRKE